MILFRTLSSIIVGYVAYAFTSMLLIAVMMSTTGVAQVMLGCVGLVFIALLVCYLVAVVSGKQLESDNHIALFIVASLIVVATSANLFLELGAEPVWYKLGTLFVLVPGTIVFDRVIRKHKSQKTPVQ